MRESTNHLFRGKKEISEGYKNHRYKASGFMEPRTVDDYPICDNLVSLSLKRRRWALSSNQVGVSFGVSGKKLQRQYKNHLSQYHSWKH